MNNNFNQFISELRRHLKHMSAEETKSAALVLAAYVLGEHREDVLAMLGRKPENGLAAGQEDSAAPGALTERVAELLKRADRGDFRFEWTYAESEHGWGRDYWDDDNEELCDCDGFGEEAEACLKMCVACVRAGHYAEACGALDALSEIDISSEDESVGFSELFEYGFVQSDLDEILLCHAYAALMSLSGEERIQKLFAIVERASEGPDIRDVAEAGEDEIPDRADFAARWLAFLMKTHEERPVRPQKIYGEPDLDRLIVDAVLFKGGTDELAAFVKDCGGRFPVACTELIEIYIAGGRSTEAITTATEALSAIADRDGRRAVADLLYEAGLAAKCEEATQTGAAEGFRASFDLNHYLRLRRSVDESVLRAETQNFELRADKDNADADYIRFLSGGMTRLWEDCSRNDAALGWSGSQKSRILPLFPALSELLHGDDDGAVGVCTAEAIRLSFGCGNNEADRVFEEFLSVMPQCARTLSPEDEEKYLAWCVKETGNRVEAIVGGKFRRSYEGAARLLVAVAEALCAKRGVAAAETYMLEFRNKYPRHTAFHACLHECAAKSGFRVKI
jgi:hypothetical protein